VVAGASNHSTAKGGMGFKFLATGAGVFELTLVGEVGDHVHDGLSRFLRRTGRDWRRGGKMVLGS
jgi:hypothetical protein